MFGIPIEVISMGFSTLFGAGLKLWGQAQEDKAKEREYLLTMHRERREDRQLALQLGQDGFAKFTRRIIVLTMLGFVGFILLAPLLGEPTNVMVENTVTTGWWLWEETKTLHEWVKLEGVVTPEWLKFAILDIIGFYFGTSSVARK